MDKITVGVLTISDRCFRKEAEDVSGPNLAKMLEDGLIPNCTVVKKELVCDDRDDIEKVLKEWSSQRTDLILTTGGTGVAERDVTPEATMAVLEKTIPGISRLMFQKSSEATPFAALSRGLAGVREKSLIVNLPGSVNGSKECLEAIAEVVPHAVDLITGKKRIVHALRERKKSSVVVCNPAKRRTTSPYPCIYVSDAQKIVMERIYLLRREMEVKYDKAMFHVLATDIPARENLPPFDTSLKDGYAVISSDYDNIRRVVGESVPGGNAVADLMPSGSCARVSTGAPLPPGTDAVVQIEDTRVYEESYDSGTFKIRLSVLPRKGKDVRPKGSDLKVGRLILESGTFLDSAAIGLLAAAGVKSVRVYQKPTVAVISTGNELVNPGEAVSGSKVRDSNRITLIRLLKEEHFDAVDLGIVKDDPDDLLEALDRGFRTADVVVTSGSMSMGERDFLKEVLVADFNAEILFGRVFMKPGKPTCAAMVDFEGRPKLFFGLPGNPASCFVTAHLFLLPALRKISKFEKIFPLSVKVRKTVENLPPQEDRPHYVRGNLKFDTTSEEWLATAMPNQNSSYIGSCVGANCLLVVNNDNGKKNTRPDGMEALLIGKI